MSRRAGFVLQDRVAIITGGASGLGLATAKNFILSGAKVMIADYSDKGAEVAKEIGASFVKVDVSVEADVKSMVEKTVEEFGRLDILVASAGIGGQQNMIADENMENWNRVNEVDYTGVMLSDKYAIMQMRKQGGGGAIVNLASMFGLVAVPTNIAYSAAKGGVINLTKAAGTAYAHEGIRVNAVCPGVIDTPLIPEDAKVQYRMLHPMRRLGEAWEVATLITFLCTDDAKFISGAAIPIDGGYTAV
ncbi:SDR family NAD(P)-dependent oxidoreductase [Parasporobacterium paucivorans]|uniref:NAD(P)-dependent dehydrogenase, short-chain alcohol dehydrogenase family n=1 Tax=Parasporobacterium paucivorans DSM 15970 TaxID=1122934 RepID=A0A1M6H093_9FIRM|nr:SDR family oxidoreductase [Parasporobacterium paucivorans]SHJ15679.1 NAD(P)-dependent dehydrogenase, short-chain alcohol dehydrogenase family [Parasporobacterium paucivorans DSM 15970]